MRVSFVRSPAWKNMFCPYCGKEITENSSYCCFCGKPVSDFNKIDHEKDRDNVVVDGDVQEPEILLQKTEPTIQTGNPTSSDSINSLCYEDENIEREVPPVSGMSFLRQDADGVIHTGSVMNKTLDQKNVDKRNDIINEKTTIDNAGAMSFDEDKENDVDEPITDDFSVDNDDSSDFDDAASDDFIGTEDDIDYNSSYSENKIDDDELSSYDKNTAQVISLIQDHFPILMEEYARTIRAFNNEEWKTTIGAARSVLEGLVNGIIANQLPWFDLNDPKINLSDKIKVLSRYKILSESLISPMHKIRSLGNSGAHFDTKNSSLKKEAKSTVSMLNNLFLNLPTYVYHIQETNEEREERRLALNNSCKETFNLVLRWSALGTILIVLATILSGYTYAAIFAIVFLLLAFTLTFLKSFTEINKGASKHVALVLPISFIVEFIIIVIVMAIH